MSSQTSEVKEQPQVSIQDAIIQLRVLENQIEQLQAVLAEIERRLGSLSGGEDAIQIVSTSDNVVLVPLDQDGHIYVKSIIQKADKVIVHIGLDVYAEVPTERALDIVRGYRAQLARAADTYRRQLAELVNYYNALRAAIERALSAAREGESQGRQT